MEVAPRVHRLTKGIVNWYLIEDGGKLTAIDAGAPHDWGHLLETLSALGRSLDDLEAVLITHAHRDHIGCAERIRTSAGASVRVHQADAPVALGGKAGKPERSLAHYLLKAQMWRTVLSLVPRGAGRLVPVREVSEFGDGETLDVPGRPTVAHTPGHTPGASALHLADRGVLFTGDGLVTMNPLTGRLGPQICPGGFNTSSQQAMDSLTRLEGLSASTILPGHGEPWTGGVGDALRLAREVGFS